MGDAAAHFPFAPGGALAGACASIRELRKAAALDGTTPPREFSDIALPILRPTFVQACLGVAVLSLGEVSAGKLVETPGSQSFAHDLFNQMHYGVQAHLAACAWFSFSP